MIIFRVVSFYTENPKVNAPTRCTYLSSNSGPESNESTGVRKIPKEVAD
jgi:hypothetical protein